MYLNDISDEGFQNLKVTLVCDVCGKEDLDETQVERVFCEKCGLVYDYCKIHLKPEFCPFETKLAGNQK